MTETSWYRTQVTQLGDQRQGFHRFFQDVVSTYEDARNCWNDTASKDVFTRFLNPHREETQRLLSLLQAHLNLNHDVLGCLESTEEPARELRRLTQASLEQRQRCASHVQKCVRGAEMAENERQVAERAMADCEDLLSRIG